MNRDSTRTGSSFDLKIQLDSRNGWIAGVCAGIARALKTDPAFVRTTVAVIALFLPKLTIAAYLIAWALLDKMPNHREVHQKQPRREERYRSRYNDRHYQSK